jgi:Xaa-Pro aminopeptidase
MKVFPSHVYERRRTEFMNNIKSGIVLFPGNNESPMNYPANTYHFRQDSTFLYFFGLNLSGLAAIIDIDRQSATIYGNDVDIESIIWMGPQPKLADLAAQTGITSTKPFAAFESDINEAKLAQRKIHFLPPYRHDNMIMLNKLLGIPVSELKTNASEEAIRAAVTLREIKDEYEIAEMTIAAKTGHEMHMAAMKMARPGLYEREIAGLVEGIALSGGGSVSFPVICSIRGETLHNHYHGNIMNKGDLLLLDCGAETEMNYCSDYTRTFPVSGEFNDRQKAIYQIVADANNKAFKLVKPGAVNRDIHLESCKIIAAGLKELGLMKGNVEDAVANGAHALFFPHGLGHMIGLDVHDMEDYGENFVGYDDEIKRATQFGTAYVRLGKKLRIGFALTIEPGIYFIPALIEKWKSEKLHQDFINYNEVEKYIGFGGIRLEDDVLVTAGGGKYIGDRLPLSVKEIEKAMNE